MCLRLYGTSLWLNYCGETDLLFIIQALHRGFVVSESSSLPYGPSPCIYAQRIQPQPCISPRHQAFDTPGKINAHRMTCQLEPWSPCCMWCRGVRAVFRGKVPASSEWLVLIVPSQRTLCLRSAPMTPCEVKLRSCAGSVGVAAF